MLLLFSTAASAVQAQFRNSDVRSPVKEADCTLVITAIDLVHPKNQLLKSRLIPGSKYKNVHPDLIKPLSIIGFILNGLLDQRDHFKVRVPFEVQAYQSNTASEYEYIYNTYRHLYNP